MEKRSFLVTELLCMFLGFLGVHRYYTGYIGLGVLQTLTLGGCGIWALIDFICISCGKYKDAKGQELEGYDQKIGLICLLVSVAFGGVSCNINSNNINKTVVNKGASSSSTVERSVNEKGEQVLKFEEATCNVTANSYFCKGALSDEDEEKIKEVQKELR